LSSGEGIADVKLFKKACCESSKYYIFKKAVLS